MPIAVAFRGIYEGTIAAVEAALLGMLVLLLSMSAVVAASECAHSDVVGRDSSIKVALLTLLESPSSSTSTGLVV